RQLQIRRSRPFGPYDRWETDGRQLATRRVGPVRAVGRLTGLAFKVMAWPIHVRGWWATLRRELPPADLYHAFGILTIPIALHVARRARREGHRGRVVYDVIDVILDSNNYAAVPAPVLAFYRWRERRWVRAADAIVTVNEPI